MDGEYFIVIVTTASVDITHCLNDSHNDVTKKKKNELIYLFTSKLYYL